jgi:hypothetical protein
MDRFNTGSSSIGSIAPDSTRNPTPRRSLL